MVPKGRLGIAWQTYQEIHFPNLQRKTRDEYAVCLRRALRELPDELTPGAVIRWHRVMLLTEQKLSATYANACLHAVRSVAKRAAVVTGDVELVSVVWHAEPVREPIRAPRLAPRDLVVKTLGCCHDPAERCFVLLASVAGLRRGEILGLRPADYDPALGTLRVERQRRNDQRKNRAPHTVIIDSQALREALEWTLTHHDDIRPPSGYWRDTYGSSQGCLFPWSLRRIEDMVTRFRAVLGPAYFPAGSAWHLFRHWGATELARNGAGLWEIQAWLGDASPTAATGYIAMVRGETISGTRGLALAAGLSHEGGSPGQAGKPNQENQLSPSCTALGVVSNAVRGPVASVTRDVNSETAPTIPAEPYPD